MRCWTRWTAATACPVRPTAPAPCMSSCCPAGARSRRSGPPSSTCRASWRTISRLQNHSTSRGRTYRDTPCLLSDPAPPTPFTVHPISALQTPHGPALFSFLFSLFSLFFFFFSIQGGGGGGSCGGGNTTSKTVPGKEFTSTFFLFLILLY